MAQDLTFQAGRNLADLEQALRDMQARLAGLTASFADEARAARDAMPDMVSDLWAQGADRLREGARVVGDEASRMGADAVRRIEDEVESRPLTTLAVAAGIGFLVGFLAKR